MVAMGMKLIITKASKKIGKFLLRTCRADLDDVGQVHRMHDLLDQHGLPRDVDTQADTSESGDDMPDPPTIDDNYTYWRDYLQDYESQPVESQVTQMTPQSPHVTVYPSDLAGPSTVTPSARRRRAQRRGRAVPAERYTPGT
jgi:hypothetical protein